MDMYIYIYAHMHVMYLVPKVTAHEELTMLHGMVVVVDPGTDMG